MGGDGHWMDWNDRMLAAYAYDNDVFEWSFESVKATSGGFWF